MYDKCTNFIPNPQDETNDNIALKADLIKDLINGKAHLKQQTSKMLLTDWLQHCKEDYQRRGRTPAQNIDKLIHSVIDYRGAKTRLCDIDKAYCKGYYDYLRNERKNEITGQPLTENTMNVYAGTLAACINAAKRAELIPGNPFELVDRQDRIRQKESTRVFLTPEEVQQLIDTPCPYPNLKKGFLFACYCGLRLSDIEALKWGDITTTADKMTLILTMKKTRRLVSVPISQTARQYLPDRGTQPDTAPIFHLGHRTNVNINLRAWADKANIKKHISFHCSRHTFATLLLSQDVNLAAVQSLLGHTDVRSTQVYAKVIDKKKEDAVNTLNNVLNQDPASPNPNPATLAPAQAPAIPEPIQTPEPIAAIETPAIPEPTPSPITNAIPFSFFLNNTQFMAEA